MTTSINPVKQAEYIVATKTFGTLISDRDEMSLIEYCQMLMRRDLDCAILGCLRSYYRLQPESFEWVMYVLCRYKGFEELVAKFFICHYQIKNNLNPPKAPES